MTPRQRILATMHHELPDRTPTDAWFHPEVQRMLLEHYRTEDWSEVLSQLGIEGWASIGPWVGFPEYVDRQTDRPGGRPGRKAVWLDENTYEDAWGVRHRMGSDDRYEEWIAGPLEGVDDVEGILNYPWPKLRDIGEPPDYPASVQRLKDQQMFVSAGIPNPFKSGWNLRGMVDFLCDYATDGELLEPLYDKLYALWGEVARRAAAAGVDMISVVGDIGMQDRLMISPESWRRFDKPRWAKLIETARAENPEVLFFFHSDGNIMDVVDDLIDVGFNVINPIQPECMNPVEVKQRWGDRIVLHGCVSIQRTLPFGSVTEVRNEIEALIRTCGYNGGLVVFPSNVLQPDTPLENIIACFHAARDLNLSQLAGKPG